MTKVQMPGSLHRLSPERNGSREKRAVEEQEREHEPAPNDETATAVEESEQANEREVPAVRRRGDIHKCPVCGSPVDADAYHCPSCRNYFCFHCRARLVPNDIELQCVNSNCDYYGKLVCEVCDVALEQEEPPTVYEEPEDGYWPGLLLVALICFGFVWSRETFWMAFLAAVGLFLAGSLLQLFGINIFGRRRIVEHRRKSIQHRCISCGQLVKEVHEAR
jgi:hypothetical protein